MKNTFKGFYKPNRDEVTLLWRNAVFVFDANVLLNLYRYRQSTTEELLSVLDLIRSRIWIPYHVGLEYQRNRVKVIASQSNRFSEVRKIVDEKLGSLKKELDGLNLKIRHSNIDPTNFINNLEELRNQFSKELDDLEESHVNVSSDDEIRNRLDVLLENKIGSRPKDQSTIDNIEKEADNRFKFKIPPGYMDDDKEGDSNSVFSFDGLLYNQKYGDVFLWKQIIEYAREECLKDLIFVTDDNKEDWWFKIKSSGEKTISPRPELIQEIRKETEIERFHMYNSLGFLKLSKEMLLANISKETIDEVRDISEVNEKISALRLGRENTVYIADRAVYRWLLKTYGENSVVFSKYSFIDFVVEVDGKKLAFHVKAITNVSMIPYCMGEFSARAQRLSQDNSIDDLSCVLVLFDPELIRDARDVVMKNVGYFNSYGVLLGLATSNSNLADSYDFTPHYHLGGAVA